MIDGQLRFGTHRLLPQIDQQRLPASCRTIDADELGGGFEIALLVARLVLGAGKVFEIDRLGAIGLDQRVIGLDGLLRLALLGIGLGDEDLHVLAAGLLGKADRFVILPGLIIERRQLARRSASGLQGRCGFAVAAGASVDIARHLRRFLDFFRRLCGVLRGLHRSDGGRGVAGLGGRGGLVQRLADGRGHCGTGGKCRDKRCGGNAKAEQGKAGVRLHEIPRK